MMRNLIYETSRGECESGPSGVKDVRGGLTVFRCIVLAVALVLPFAVLARESDTVKVGYYENEVFQEGAREGAIKSGYAYEYYRKLSEYTGWKYEYVYGEYAKLYKMLLEGKIDLLAGLAWKKERQGVIGYPDAPMGKETYNLVKHHSDTSITANPKTLKGKTIGVLDSALVDVLKKFLEGKHVTARIKIFKDYTALFVAFDAGKLDVLAAEGSGAYGRVNTELLVPFGSSSYFLCVNARRPDLLSKLNDAQSALAVEEPNFIHSLNMKYYPKTILARALSPVEKQWLKKHHALRIGFLENCMPYSGKNSKGKVTGIVKDIIPEILTSLGISSRLKVTYSGYASYNAMIADMSDGRIDVAFPVGGGLYFSEENGLYQSVPVTSMSPELVYKGYYTENTTERFAVDENNRMQYYFVQNNYPNSQVTLFPSIEACLDAVISGKVSCTVLNGLRASVMLKNRKFKNLSRHQLVKNDERCFGVEIGNEGLLKLLNRGLNVIGGEDYVQNKAYRYMQALYFYRLRDVIRDHLGLFGSLLFVGAAFIMALLIRDIRRTRRQIAEKEAAGIRLAGTNRQLMEHTRTIEQQRRQETKLREQLEKKQNELKEALLLPRAANQAKTTFLSNMSHDIRTPMNAIIGFTSLASRHVDDSELVQDYLSTIKRSSEHLLALLNDVLDMSRIESGRMTLNEKEDSLAEIIHVLREIFHADVQAKKLKFHIETEDIRNERIFCDKLRLNQILLNLLSNAVKYTGQGGTVSLRIVQKPAADVGRADFEFLVKDNGIGMSEEFVKTIFDPFTREENSTVSAIQGTGLGMAITKKLVEMMGGSISVTTKKGEGTEVVVSLNFRLSGQQTADPVIPELKGARCLIVNSDVKICQRIAAMLRDAGMRSEWSVSGQDALTHAEESLRQGDPFKFYVVEWQMEDTNGIETVRSLCKCAGKDASILILTSCDLGDIKKEAKAAGVAGFVPETLFPSDLRKALLQSCGKADPNQSGKLEPAISLKGKRVLMVDDSKLNLKIGVLLLQEQGMLIDTASNGQIAVDMVREKGAGAYDLILMDVQMPVMGGYEATGFLRKLPGGDKLKIIAFSANAFEEDREKSLLAGMDGHIAKPLKINDLLNELKRFAV